MIHYLFSYGTLQSEKVQIEIFGRILVGVKDTLKGYKLSQVEIKDAAVLQKSELQFHPIAMPSTDTNDEIHGTVFEVTSEELVQADEYEVDDYKRISVTLDSGKDAWIYVSVDAI